MSTYIYLECQDHNPPLVALDESGQHLYNLPAIIKDVANREELVALWNTNRLGEYSGSTSDPYFLRHTVQFLSQHRTCNIGIVDEYGVKYDKEGRPLS